MSSVTLLFNNISQYTIWIIQLHNCFYKFLQTNTYLILKALIATTVDFFIFKRKQDISYDLSADDSQEMSSYFL